MVRGQLNVSHYCQRTKRYAEVDKLARQHDRMNDWLTEKSAYEMTGWLPGWRRDKDGPRVRKLGRLRRKVQERKIFPVSSLFN